MREFSVQIVLSELTIVADSAAGRGDCHRHSQQRRPDASYTRAVR